MAVQNTLTVSEREFEAFLEANGLGFERVQVAVNERRPDYAVNIGALRIFFELKELSEDEDFEKDSGTGVTVSSRTVGDHIRTAIATAKGQVQYGAALGMPSILLVYNHLDPMHSFGTEEEDFIHAMYGEHTVRIGGDPPRIIDSFYGKNARFQSKLNTSFSALGRLAAVRGKMTVSLFENVHAAQKLPFELMPPCFEIRRVGR